MRVLTGAGLLGACLALGACSTSSGADGTLTGVVRSYGGPAVTRDGTPGPALTGNPAPGVPVSVRASSGHVITALTGAGGGYTLELAAGEYRVLAACGHRLGRTVTIRRDQQTRVDFGCQAS
jgi:hypothetical protein